MSRVYLALVIHNHQPVGNFPWVFQEAYDKAYSPLLSLLEAHPGIKIALHYSGPLVDWLVEHEPAFLDRLASLVSRGQVELVSGGYYEPIMPSIPDPDKVGQLEKMGRFLKDRFGVDARGVWVAERVWEPCLPRFYAEAGLDWTVLDDAHFRLAGMDHRELLGYYITEDQGYPLKVFASLKELRYSVPWHTVDSMLAWLRGLTVYGDNPVAVMGDDGEKFGLWPGTYRHCWQEGWMERFFQALEENAHWLTTVTPGGFAEVFPPLGTVYLPCASYPEMMGWSLPPEAAYEFDRLVRELEAQGRKDVLRFFRGGFWRNFLARYPEVNAMHKKMLRVHRKAHAAVRQGADRKVLDFLWEGQCNCPYWHGVFGGIYIADIRSANYNRLIRSESLADVALSAEPSSQIEDYDKDGFPELLLEALHMNLYIEPRWGGGIVEWDLRGPAHNLAASLTRRPEAYHRAVLERAAIEAEDRVVSIHEAIRVKDASVSGAIRYDAYPRISGLEHLLEPLASPEDFEAGSPNLGHSLAQKAWRVIGHGADPVPWAALECSTFITVRKEYRLEGQALRISYLLANGEDTSLTVRFASEWNLNLLAFRNPAAFGIFGDRRTTLDARALFGSLAQFELHNHAIGVHLVADVVPAAQLWMMPLESVSSSEGGLEKLYQATTLVLVWSIELPARSSREVGLIWRMMS
jgi:hypothetical protein